MKYTVSVVARLACVAAVAAVVPTLLAQPPAASPAPRTSWGTPDLRGVWNGTTMQSLAAPFTSPNGLHVAANGEVWIAQENVPALARWNGAAWSQVTGAPGKVMTLTLSVRAGRVDDVQDSRWLAVLVALLELPEWLID